MYVSLSLLITPVFTLCECTKLTDTSHSLVSVVPADWLGVNRNFPEKADILSYSTTLSPRAKSHRT